MGQSGRVGLLLTLLLSLGLSSCGGSGGSSSGTTNSVPASVTIAPTVLSMERGAIAQASVQVKDAAGKIIFTSTPTFSSSNTAKVTVSNGGLLCAGTWDSLTAPVVCTPAASAGTSNVTATAGSITSAPLVVSVHDHVDNITLSPLSVNCDSQNVTEKFAATAFSGGFDITPTVGTFSWLSSDGTVATIDVAGPSNPGPPLLTAFEAQIKAKNSGLTNISASISGTNSVAAPFITCSPATITIDVPTPTLPDTASSFTIATGLTKQLDSKVVDTMLTTITGLTLTWNSSQPAIATVSTSGLVTGVAPGVSIITASCTPPSCNPGLGTAVVSNQVYSNPVTANIILGTATTTTVYATTTSAPDATKGSSLIPITTSTAGPATLGTAITLPTDAKVNSLLINPAGTRAFLGSSKGLVVVDVTANTVLATVTNALGTALTVSPNGQFIVSSDGSKVYVYDAANNLVTTLTTPGATHASFTPDSFKAYIVAGGTNTLYQYSPSLTLRTITMSAAANDVAVNSTGQFAYVAGGEAASVVDRATCLNDSTWAPAAGDIVATGVTPDLIASASTGDLVAVEGSTSRMDKVTPTIGAPLAGSCPPTVSNALAFAGFGVGLFTPRQIIVTPDGSKAYVTSDMASILVFNVGPATAATAIPLLGGATQSFTGGVTLDGKMLYVGTAGDKAVHRIDTALASDAQQISITFPNCAGCPPDLVAVRPH